MIVHLFASIATKATILPFPREATIPKLLTFGLAGIVGTATHYLTLILLVEAAGLDPVAATSLGFAVGAAVNYALNHRFTFESRTAHRDIVPKFFLVAAATALLNGALVQVGVELLSLNYLLVQVAATGAVFLANFALNSIWTFRESDAA